jgi:hypothetical protein
LYSCLRIDRVTHTSAGTRSQLYTTGNGGEVPQQIGPTMWQAKLSNFITLLRLAPQRQSVNIWVHSTNLIVDGKFLQGVCTDRGKATRSSDAVFFGEFWTVLCWTTKRTMLQLNKKSQQAIRCAPVTRRCFGVDVRRSGDFSKISTHIGLTCLQLLID